MVSTMKSTLEDRFRTGQKLQRRGTKHVKSGCRTCKVRRVKCDETRPACGRCTSTGRTCDGYGIWSTSAGTGISHGFHQRQSPSSVVSTTPPRDTIEYGWCMSPLLDGNCKMFNLLDRRVDADELVCLDFFRLRCLVKLPGFFDARTNLVGTIPDVFDSLQECRQYLEVLLNKSLHLINKSSGSTPSFSLGEPEYHFPETREQLIETLAQWKCAYEKLTQKVRPNITVYAYIALNLLRIWSLKVEIMLRTCPATNEPWNEMAFDKYTHLFEEILSASDDVVLMRGFPGNFVLQDAKCHTGPLNFSADMGPVPVLYYIALKCRVPSIKRRAIQALRAAPHREAVWDGIAVAAAAETVIRLEEGDFFGVFNDAYPSVAYSLSSVQKDVLPEWSRFQDVRIIMEDGLQLGGTIIGRRKREDSNIFSSFLGEDDSSKWEPVEEPFQCGERLSTYTWSNIQDMYKAANLSSA
ncbi:hypothetical protein EYB25_006736 [Talaromyces marneffei]|nr:hypothetical protein EYB25_006736 [Talaromyces marneffei]